MKNIQELFKSIVELQPLIEKRGYELINARDFYKERPERIKPCKYTKSIEFEEDGVICSYYEDTFSDIIEEVDCRLSIELLEKTEEEWEDYLEYIDTIQLKEYEEKQKRNKEEELKRKQTQLESLQKQIEKLNSEIITE